MLVTPFLLQSHLFVENAEWIFSIRKQQQQNKKKKTQQISQEAIQIPPHSRGEMQYPSL